MKFRHNKKRNPALLYEFLVRHISKCLVENDTQSAEKALEISKKFFGKGKPLNEELGLFRSVLDTNVKSRHSAQKIVNNICEKAKSLNVRSLDAEKSKLIKEINYVLKDQGLYNHKVPNYVVYASISALLNDSRNRKKVLTQVQKIRLEDVICEHLVSEKKVSKVNLDKKPKYNKVVYNFVFERFHKKYDKKLSESQRKLLTSYAAYKISKNEQGIKDILTKEIEEIKSKLNFVKDDEIREDKELMTNLQECVRKFGSVNTGDVSDEVVTEVLRYMQLADEVES